MNLIRCPTFYGTEISCACIAYFFAIIIFSPCLRSALKYILETHGSVLQLYFPIFVLHFRPKLAWSQRTKVIRQCRVAFISLVSRLSVCTPTDDSSWTFIIINSASSGRFTSRPSRSLLIDIDKLSARNIQPSIYLSTSPPRRVKKYICNE